MGYASKTLFCIGVLFCSFEYLISIKQPQGKRDNENPLVVVQVGHLALAGHVLVSANL